MSIALPPPRQTKCIYCGIRNAVVKRGSGEHILPKAIGGVCRISHLTSNYGVCQACNNGTLSQLDSQFSILSPIALIAAEDFRRKGLRRSIFSTWDVDHSNGNLMLEANPDISAHNVTLYPQLIIEDRGVSLYGDFDHIESFGCERFWRVFTKHLRKAVNDFTCGKKGRLFYKKIRGIEALRAQYRFPPRVFAPCHVSEIDSDTSFRLHYAEPSRWQQALSRLRNLDLSARLERFEKHAGSELPVFHLSCQPLQICRSLVKFAINSLAATFQQTEFNNRRFREAISFVMGDSTIFTDIRSIQRILASNGFVEPSTLADISRIDSHVVRLVHDSSEQMWHGYFSFFGGQVCAVATFPGPNFEDWSSVELCFKVASKSHSVKTYRLTLPPTTTKVTWQQVPKMLPTLPLRNIHTQLSYTEN